MDIVSIAVAVATGGGATYCTQAVSAWFKSRTDREARRDALDATLDQHRDQLTFDLLSAAREEVAAARVEAIELRSLQLRLTHFEEALDHIQALIDVTDAASRTAAERRATQFLIRMKRLSEARGAVLNEQQIIESRARLEGGPTE